ncbi:hypothetical protein [Streptomyces sp. SID8014]|uniref:hypothetical protein n=1 Tax=Streptomyces sp. SID8014 TaxID=2706097 RepID=UPI001EF2C6CC|nr:hypothetical protein [Streptomyces sp. SID8014]
MRRPAGGARGRAGRPNGLGRGAVRGGAPYRGGSLYHAAGDDELFLACAALVMTTVVLGGLLVRQERRWFRLGFDGALLVLVHAATLTILAF